MTMAADDGIGDWQWMWRGGGGQKSLGQGGHRCSQSEPENSGHRQCTPYVELLSSVGVLRYFRGGPLMKKLTLLGIVAGAALLSLAPVSVQWTPDRKSTRLNSSHLGIS